MSYVPPTIETKHFTGLLAGLPSLSGKTVAITGTSSGTGFILAGAVAKLGARVLLLNRASSRAEEALKKLQTAYPETNFVAIACDLQNFESVKAAGAEVNTLCAEKGLAVLVNNAGVMAMPDVRTADGYDVQMQTNHLSHFLLTKEVMVSLKKAAELDGEARMVNHSSGAARGSPIDAAFFEKCEPDTLGGFQADVPGFVDADGKPLGQWARYHNSKLANQLFTHAFNDKAKEAGSKVISIVCQPGLAATNLQATTNTAGGMEDDFTKKFMANSHSAEDGTCGILIATAQKDLEGNFYGPPGMTGAAISLPLEDNFHAQEGKDILWSQSVKAVGEIVF
jgi:NAD(P)-dependent dehydrogenase (short-subunit alcohol dehydrogenase family)